MREKEYRFQLQTEELVKKNFNFSKKKIPKIFLKEYLLTN